VSLSSENTSAQIVDPVGEKATGRLGKNSLRQCHLARSSGRKGETLWVGGRAFKKSFQVLSQPNVRFRCRWPSHCYGRFAPAGAAGLATGDGCTPTTPVARGNRTVCELDPGQGRRSLLRPYPGRMWCRFASQGDAITAAPVAKVPLAPPGHNAQPCWLVRPAISMHVLRGGSEADDTTNVALSAAKAIDSCHSLGTTRKVS